MVTRTEAIKAFLIKNTHEDLAALYDYEIECQVNVAQDNGERVEGDYKGRQWHGWTDDSGQVWKSFRIPYNANTVPVYEDRTMSFDLSQHAEGIGLTGWDWQNQLSKWIAFDFDAITGHSDKHTKKLTAEQLHEIKDAAINIPWVTVRFSTSGKGLHLYVMLKPTNTTNHTEHAALARSILGLMSAYTGFDFKSKVDVCGGNMWVWHRKMQGTNGLQLIKQGDVLIDVPINWRDHINVITNKRPKPKPQCIEEKDIDVFEEMSSQRSRIPLDEEHRKLISFLVETKAAFWWDQDHHMLVCHTWDLLQAHEALRLRGLFKTFATGKQHGTDHNCFAFPLRRGAWAIRRYTPGIAEDTTWEQDGKGWTRCYYNKEPDLRTAAIGNEGIEDEGNKFVFRHGGLAEQAALMLGSELNIPPGYNGRQTIIKMHKDGRRIVVEFDRQPSDRQDDLKGWLPVKGDKWRRILTTNVTNNTEPDVENYDDVCRHLITEDGTDCGWVIHVDGKWNEEPLVHIRTALESLGLKTPEIKVILGNCVMRPWKLVNRPFKPEFPGDRQWNRYAAQFRFIPNLTTDNRQYSTWLHILNHIGADLNRCVQDSVWAQQNGLTSGADYLKCWIASLFQYPEEPLPYLFLYGPQNSGKSILHEALSLLLTTGYKHAAAALVSPQGFNAELENMILCVVEEVDLRKNTQAYNRIKDWVTSLQLLIHKKNLTPYQINNTTHWIQCSNDRSYCPVFTGDTRITMIYVPELEEVIPKRDLIQRLEKEAPDFLAEILTLEIPQSNDRLNLPILATDDKLTATKANQSLLELFIDEQCHYIPGSVISVAEFYDEFHKWLDPNDRYDWSKIKIGREMPKRFPKGRLTTNAQWHYGNISFSAETVPSKLLTQHKDFLYETQSHNDNNS